MTTAVSG